MQKQQQVFPDGTDVFLVLSDQSFVTNNKQIADTFYVQGIITNGEFAATKNAGVLGRGELGKSGRYGWLELKSREFFPMESDKKAITPFVKGYMTDKGFIPSVRDVFDEP